MVNEGMVKEIVLVGKDESSYPGEVWQSFIAFTTTGMKLDSMMLIDEANNHIYNTIYALLSSRINEDGTWKYPRLSEMSEYLKKLVTDISTSYNEICFIEYDDDELNELIINQPNFLELLQKEVTRFGLNDVIEIENSVNCYITINSHLMSAINYD